MSGDSTTMEYVVYFISSSFCVANRQPGFLEAVAKIRPQVLAHAHGRPVSLAGVSVDVRVDTGVAYLQRTGSWDEIVAGANWMNLAVVRYIWQSGYGTPTIPQVIVIRRQVTRSPRSIRVGDDERVLVASGHEAIEDWVARGSPIP